MIYTEQADGTYWPVIDTEAPLKKRVVGKINKVEGGFQYVPKGCDALRFGGEVFPTFRECLKSLQGD